ncbi:unnamed protein product, partial [Mesorhabditis spiculigera]
MIVVLIFVIYALLLSPEFAAQQCFAGDDIAEFKIEGLMPKKWRANNRDVRFVHLNDGHMGINFCIIPKVMSSTLGFVACDVFLAFHGSTMVSGNSTNSLCRRRPRLRDELKARQGQWDIPERPVEFAIAREPISRFLSGFMDVCDRRQNCGNLTVHEFAKALYNSLDRNPIEWTAPGDEQPIFHHFVPQVWYCDAKIPRLRYSSDGGEVADQIEGFLKEAWVPDGLAKKISSRVRDEKKNPNPQSDDRKAYLRQEIFSNCETLQYLVATYYDDYVKLGYPIPTSVYPNQPKVPETQELVRRTREVGRNPDFYNLEDEELLFNPEAKPNIAKPTSESPKIQRMFLNFHQEASETTTLAGFPNFRPDPLVPMRYKKRRHHRKPALRNPVNVNRAVRNMKIIYNRTVRSFKIPTNAAKHWGRDHPDERLDPAVNDGHYGLKSCHVPKVMSTMMTFVMCDVYHAYHGDKADSGHDIRGDCTEWHEQNRELRGKPRAWHAAQPPVHFAVSREPISRFVSGYMALCMQWNDCAGMGVHDFAQALYAAFRKRVPRLRTRGKNGRILKHFAPQTWYCNKPNLYRFKYSANTTQMADEFVKVLQLAKVPAKILKQIHRRVTDEPANFGIHSDNKKKAMLKEIYSNCDTLRSLVGLYYDDFNELGFPIPTIANSTTSEAQKKIEPEVKVNGDANEALQKMMPLLVPQTTTVTSETIKEDLKMIAESNAAFDDDMKAAAFAAPTLEIDRKREKKHRKRDGVFEKAKVQQYDMRECS